MLLNKQNLYWIFWGLVVVAFMSDAPALAQTSQANAIAKRGLVPRAVKAVREAPKTDKPGSHAVREGDAPHLIDLQYGQLQEKDLLIWTRLGTGGDIQLGQVLRIAPPEAMQASEVLAPQETTKAIVQPPDAQLLPVAPLAVEFERESTKSQPVAVHMQLAPIVVDESEDAKPLAHAQVVPLLVMESAAEAPAAVESEPQVAPVQAEFVVSQPELVRPQEPVQSVEVKVQSEPVVAPELEGVKPLAQVAANPLLVMEPAAVVSVTTAPTAVVSGPEAVPELPAPISVQAPPVIEVALGPALTAKSPAALATLRELVLQTLVRNPDLAQARAESHQAAARWRQIRTGVLPQTSINAAYGQEQRNYALTSSSNRYSNQNQMQLRVSQPLFDESLSARIRQASATMLSGDWALIAVREQTMLKTIELYAELLRQTRLVTLARDNLKSHRQYVAQMKSIARIDLGRASDLPVAQSRAALAESVLKGRLSRLEVARTQWRAHTTLQSPDQSAIHAVSEGLMDLPPVDLPVSMDEAISQAIALSPQMQKAMADMQVSSEALRAVQSGTLPKLNADAQIQNANNFAGVFGEQRTWFTGVSMQWSWDLGASHASRAALEGVKATEQAADAQLLRLRSVVESQWFELLASQAVLESYKTYEEQSGEVVRSHAEQFRIGRRSLLDVLNAENELFTARSNVVTTGVDVSLASWRLLSLRGLLADELDL